MAEANLRKPGRRIIAAGAGLAIKLYNFGIVGGRTLDVTGYPKTVIQEGHPIIRSTASGEYKPMPLNGGGTALAALPANHEYVGLLRAEIITADPRAAIMTNGVANDACFEFDFSGIKTAFKAQVPFIEFQAD